MLPRPEVTVAVPGAPGICVTTSALPTRSTIAIVAGLPRAVASCTACSTIVLTSSSVRFGLVLLTGAAGLVGAVGDTPEVETPVPPPPPQPPGAMHQTDRTAMAARNAGWEKRENCPRALRDNAARLLEMTFCFFGTILST